MFRIRYTVIVLFIIITIYKINCASVGREREICKKALRELELKIRDETATANSSLEARSRNKRLMKYEKIQTPSGESVSITSPMAREVQCGKKAKFIRLYEHGRMSGKEFKLVHDEVFKTTGTGCFKILKILKVQNGCLWNEYKSRRRDIQIESKTKDTNERLLFYGNNVWNITKSGFDERLSAGGPFGAGIYFTDQFSVADAAANNQCSSCRRKVLLNRVILGKQSQMKNRVQAHAPIGHDSVVGKQAGNLHDDYVIYRGEQAYPEYVITYKSCEKKIRKKIYKDVY